ncbi:MAG TPA: MBL fold metallo-hydrolase [Dongiaceae bacterium]|jgi:phosphoribosyl 1,2-cyclic phosphodiesterase|nr:MBL fold metallo-hydrolase [Dongiaceae bacterium]
MREGDFFLRFWGVRGSIPCPGPEYIRYGGNTPCIEVRCGRQLLILDGGTGLRPLGKYLSDLGEVDADIFLTHTHLDHIMGIPFFGPIYDKHSNLNLWAGHLAPPHQLRDVLAGMMIDPLFPVPIDFFGSKPHYHDFNIGDTLYPRSGVVVKTAPLNHPNGATGYRIEYQGKSICYVTDTEHDTAAPNQTIIELIRGADLFIYDSTFTEDEYEKYRGWGHSTWQEGAKLADLAEVKTFVIFHHDPSHNDAAMDSIAAQAHRRRPGTLVAREGMILTP